MYSTPKWASTHQTNIIHQQQQQQNSVQKSPSPLPKNPDEHYSRHLENVPNCKDDEDDCSETDSSQAAKSTEEEKSSKEEEEDELHRDDEPKVFQVEDVDLPSLITKPNSKPTSPLLNGMKPVDNLAFGTKANSLVKQNFMATINTNLPVVVKSSVEPDSTLNLASTMATPNHYFSRSSSMTSLNSFDIKSIHSEIASEYSQVTSQVTSPRQRKLDHSELNHSDLLDDLENLNMPESPSALENSFLMAQRFIHKQQQAVYRQNAAVAMGLPNKIMPATSSQGYNNGRILKSANDSSQYSSYNPVVFEQSVNLVKPWTNKPAAGNDLNAIMSRLNLQKTANFNTSSTNTNTVVNVKADNARSKGNSESSDSETDSDSSDSLSFLNENQQQAAGKAMPKKPLNLITNSLSITHTPPVKLQAAPKFVQQKSIIGSNNGIPTSGTTTNKMNSNTTPTTAPVINQFNSNQVASMSVSYAFMKNSNQINTTSCTQLIHDKSANKKTALPQVQLQNYIPNMSYQPKFLQTSNNNQQSYFQQTQSQQNQPAFNFNQPTQTNPANNLSSSSSSTSSQNSIKQLSPTNSEHVPHVYMVEKTSNALTPQASKIRSMDRPPSPQESVCSMMSDSSIPSIIRQDITRSAQGFQHIKQQPQNDFKALFNKINQQSPANTQGVQFVAKSNNLMPAFNFLKSNNNGNFNQVQSSYSNLNTPTNNHNNSNHQRMNYSDLDCTYSPKIFQNEGTNSRYESDSDEEPPSETQKEPTHLSPQNRIQQNQDDQDELLLENFIKEMLPPVASSNDDPCPRMASSISSEAPFTHLGQSKTKLKNSGSSSSLNSLPVTRPRMNFSRATTSTTDKRTRTNSNSTTSTKVPLRNTTASKTAAKPFIRKQPEPAKSATPVKKPATKVVNKIPGPCPVVVMTRTSQLRAKLVSSNNRNNSNNSLNSSVCSVKSTDRPRPVFNASGNTRSNQRPKDKVNTAKGTGSSVTLNPHLEHLNRAGGTRRKSFTCGANTASKLDKLKNKETTEASVGAAGSSCSKAPIASKVKATWK